MSPEHLILAAALDIRTRRNVGIDDRLLEDVGMTREEYIRQHRWFRRKPH